MPQKKCRTCKEYKEINHFSRANIGEYGVNSICRSCMQERIQEYSKAQRYREKTTQKRGHKFSDKVRKQIFDRDQQCINPNCKKILFARPHAHHIYFHSREKDYNFETANRVECGVQLCFFCHDALHKGDKELDHYCHVYIAKFYNTL